MKYTCQRMVLMGVLMCAAATDTIATVHARGLFCALCGNSNSCQKTCRLVCEPKKVTVTCWGCKDEDFCVPGPSSVGWKHCDMVCDDESDPKAPCVQPKKFVWKEWIPGSCAQVYTKKKLMKRTITKTIPSFKWVVEDLCSQCQAECQIPNVPPGTKLPPVPMTDAKMIVAEPAPVPVPAVSQEEDNAAPIRK